jgi:vancomycin permeability regulator SanA
MIFFTQKIRKKYFRLFHWLRFGLLGLLISLLVIPLTATAYISLMTNGIRYIKPEEVPQEQLAMIFGAGLLANGEPTPMLADRVEAGVKLYQIGRVKKLLMTGDNSKVSYNEVRSMQQYAHDLGVPTKDITLDYAGFSTYESCYRAHKIFGLHKAVVITQNYHLPRAIYTCRQFGLDTVGLGTPDIEIYGLWGMIPDLRREMLANVKALWEVHVTRPRPTFLGRFEKI